MVEMTGFEPATSASRTQRSTKLSHISLINSNIITHFFAKIKYFLKKVTRKCQKVVKMMKNRVQFCGFSIAVR